MKTAIGVILACAVFCTADVNAQESSRYTLAEELMTVMNVQENIEKSFAMMRQMLPAQMEKMKQFDIPADSTGQTEKALDIVTEAFKWENIKADYIALYADTFTEEEMRGIIAFYKSPTGQALLEKQPLLMKGSMELNQKQMMGIMPKIKAMQEEMKKAAGGKTGK